MYIYYATLFVCQMNSKSPDIENWRNAFGLCMICGQPLGVKIKTLLPSIEQLSINDSEDIETSSSTLDDFIDRFLLVEECPVRVALVQYNMLGEHQDCHIIDQYTFLEKRNKEENFVNLLKKNEAMISSLDENGIFKLFLKQAFLKEGLSSKMTEQAVSMCKRLGDHYIFCGCRRCNICMNKPNFHVDVVYRCFDPTKNLDKPYLESRNVKAGKLKKIIQQIAFFFEYNESQWYVKDEIRMIQDIDIWRCISNLCYWGNSSKYRFRLIAIFHASHFIYEQSSIKTLLKFEDWHIHFFREKYMNTYKNGTWFGMTENEARVYFNLSEKKGNEWVPFVKARLSEFRERIEEFHESKSTSKILLLKDSMKRDIINERSLLRFLVARGSVEQGIERFLFYFKYNVILNNEKKLMHRYSIFEKQLCSTYRKHVKDAKDVYES